MWCLHWAGSAQGQAAALLSELSTLTSAPLVKMSVSGISFDNSKKGLILKWWICIRVCHKREMLTFNIAMSLLFVWDCDISQLYLTHMVCTKTPQSRLFPQQDLFLTDPNFEERGRREMERPGERWAGLDTGRQPDRHQVHCQPLSPVTR